MTKIRIAATLLLASALGSSEASAEIIVGPGFGTTCAQGSCPIFQGSVNAIGAHSLDLFQSSTSPVDTGSVLLIFAVPNNPTNALTANPVTDAQLHVPAANGSSSTVTVGSLSAETLMTHGEVYGTLGLLDGASVGFPSLQSADYFLFPTTYNPSTNPITNFSLYEIPLTTTGGTVFAGNDLINVDFTSLPVGTFALGYATPSLTVTDTSFAQAGVSGIVTAVPEPASLTLFGSALFCLGWWRHRRI
jgi:hypothetical protein